MLRRPRSRRLVVESLDPRRMLAADLALAICPFEPAPAVPAEAPVAGDAVIGDAVVGDAFADAPLVADATLETLALDQIEAEGEGQATFIDITSLQVSESTGGGMTVYTVYGHVSTDAEPYEVVIEISDAFVAEGGVDESFNFSFIFNEYPFSDTVSATAMVDLLSDTANATV